MKSYHEKYLGAEANGKVNANKVVVGLKETFTVEKLDEGNVALKAYHGMYLVSEEDGRLNANRRSVGTWESFTLVCIGKFVFPEYLYYITIYLVKICNKQFGS